MMRGSFLENGHWQAQRQSFTSVMEAVEHGHDHYSATTAIAAPGGRSITYAGLRRQVMETTGDLAAVLKTPGARVAVCMSDHMEMAITLIAVMSYHVAVPINPAMRDIDTRNVLLGTRPEILLTDSGTPPRIWTAASGAGVRVVDRSSLRSRSTDTGEMPCRTEKDDALILSTSGTSGSPSLVYLTHENILAGAGASCYAYGLEPSDVRFNVMPLHHVQGIVGSLMATLVSGGTFASFPFKPHNFARTMSEVRATWFSASPTMHRLIISANENGDRIARVPSLRFVRSGSAALPAVLAKQIGMLWGVPVVESYGMTEAHQIASTSLDRAKRGDGGIGSPTGADVAIVPNADGVDQIWIRGPAVARRTQSLMADQLTAAPTTAGEDDYARQGWFPTGDTGALDRHGHLQVHGRIREIINCGGEKFAPVEIEEVIRAHPGVADALVFGIPDDTYGEVAAALVVPANGGSLPVEELRSYLTGLLNPAKCPHVFSSVTAIPVGRSGKINRKAIASAYTAGTL